MDLVQVTVAARGHRHAFAAEFHVIVLVVAAAAAISGGTAEFKNAYPNASAVPKPDGARLTHASGFKATGMGDPPEAAAATFLHEHRAAFGISAVRRPSAIDGRWR